jgi:sigma-B regulation protein RsbU (phosphoserine phosphatase)
LEGVQGIPLGISVEQKYRDRTEVLQPGDQIIFYTDGITEATNPAGQLFGLGRLDGVLEDCKEDASDLLNAVLRALEEFTAGQPPADDRTLLVAKIW